MNKLPVSRHWSVGGKKHTHTTSLNAAPDMPEQSRVGTRVRYSYELLQSVKPPCSVAACHDIGCGESSKVKKVSWLTAHSLICPGLTSPCVGRDAMEPINLFEWSFDLSALPSSTNILTIWNPKTIVLMCGLLWTNEEKTSRVAHQVYGRERERESK